MPQTQELNIAETCKGERLDVHLSALNLFPSRSAAQKVMDEGGVLVNGHRVKKNYRLSGGETVVVTIPDPIELEEKAADIPLNIVFEDEHLLVVNKPKGMVVHPAAGHSGDTLVNALLHHCGDSLSGINGVIRPGIVHRIDKDTSGLLIVAKTDRAHIGLAEQIKAHSFGRAYQTVVLGNVKENNFTINKSIGRSPANRKRRAIDGIMAKPAVTHVEVLTHYDGFTHLLCRLETGRTHQIRVHLASIGHPVAGDAMYGGGKVKFHLNGQCLHACHIDFDHPITHERLSFDTPLPDEFERFLRSLK